MFLIFLFEKCGAVMGIMGIVIGLVFVLGLILFGWIIDFYIWCDFFGMVILIVVLVLILVLFLMKNVI